MIPQTADTSLPVLDSSLFGAIITGKMKSTRERKRRRTSSSSLQFEGFSVHCRYALQSRGGEKDEYRREDGYIESHSVT